MDNQNSVGKVVIVSFSESFLAKSLITKLGDPGIQSVFVHADIKEIEKYARWVYGQHPTDKIILGYIQQNAMYILEENGVILAAVAVTMSQPEDYHNIEWQHELMDDEAAVVHILCTNPDYQKQGIGRKMVEECVCLAKKAGKKAVRLDALESNTPAHRMYEAMGFELRGKQNLYAENTGWTIFLFFEYSS